MTKLAKVGQNIETQNAGWTFDGKVADTFVDHVRQSVPLYEKGHELVCQLSDYFVDKTSVVYELGTSTGELIRKVARHNAHRDGARFIGIDGAEGAPEQIQLCFVLAICSSKKPVDELRWFSGHAPFSLPRLQQKPPQLLDRDVFF